LEILSLAPFENYEGDVSPLSDRLKKASHWMEVARALGAFHLQVPAQYKPDAIGDKNVVVFELQQLADLGSAKQPMVSVAYEPLKVVLAKRMIRQESLSPLHLMPQVRINYPSGSSELQRHHMPCGE
jgi:hypothetical protein